MQIQKKQADVFRWHSELKMVHVFLSRVSASLLITTIVLFSGSAYAATEVTLTLIAPTDTNGNLIVFDGDKLKVRFKVVEDDPRILHKADKIQLLRVSDDSLVSAAGRGKKNSGTVVLKVKNSIGEALYVNYVRKGSGDEIVRVSHPDDEDITPLQSIAGANLKDLAINVNALTSGQYNINGGEFLPAFTTNSTEWHRAPFLGHYGFPTTSGTKNVVAAVHLPNGVTIRVIRCSYLDFNETHDVASVVFRLYRNDLESTGGEEVVSVTGTPTTGASLTKYVVQTEDDLDLVVDNFSNSYHLRVQFAATGGFTAPNDSAIALYGCSVIYS